MIKSNINLKTFPRTISLGSPIGTSNKKFYGCDLSDIPSSVYLNKCPRCNHYNCKDKINHNIEYEKLKIQLLYGRYE